MSWFNKKKKKKGVSVRIVGGTTINGKTAKAHYIEGKTRTDAKEKRRKSGIENPEERKKKTLNRVKKIKEDLNKKPRKKGEAENIRANKISQKTLEQEPIKRKEEEKKQDDLLVNKNLEAENLQDEPRLGETDTRKKPIIERSDELKQDDKRAVVLKDINKGLAIGIGILALAVGGVYFAGAAGATAAGIGRTVIVRTATARGGITKVVQRTAVKISPKVLSEGTAFLKNIKSIQGIKNLFTTKNMILSGIGISGASGMATWLASDNILTNTGMQANNIVDGIQFAGLSKAEGLQEIERLEATANMAESFIRKNIKLNPALWLFGKAYLTNAEQSRRSLELSKTRALML